MNKGLTFNIGLALRATRLRADLSIDEIAARTAIPVPRLARIESGRTTTTLDELFALKLALNVSVRELLRELREDDDQNDAGNSGPST